MTNQEAIEELKARKEHYEMGDGCEFLVEALEKGIKALENQKTVIEKLEKLKAEFEEDKYILLNQITAIKVIDKHIAELKGE